MSERTLPDDRAAGEEQSFSRRFLPFLALIFLVWALRATVLFAIDEAIVSEAWGPLYSNTVKFLIWVLPVLLYLRYVDRVDPFAYLRLTTRPDSPGLVRAAVAMVLFFAAILVFEALVSGKDIAAVFDRARSPQSLGVLASVALSPLLEEILFRGFVLRKLAERFGFWGANLLSSLLFVWVHWPHWLWVDWRASWILPTSVSIFILGCFLGYLVKRTSSLWPSVVAHIANNFLASLLRAQ